MANRTAWLFSGLVFAGLCVLGCSSVQEMVKSGIQRPTVEFTDARITGLSFRNVDLLFDLKVSNPNLVGITLASFDYDFLIDNRSFVKGNQDEGLNIAANGESTVRIPVSLQFADIYQTFKKFGSQDSASYEVRAGFSFDLPILGVQRVPVGKKGSLPLLKLPRLRVESLRLRSLKFTGADLELNLMLSNPNPFGFDLNALNYQFDINDSEWVSGVSEERFAIAAGNENRVRIPIALNFLEIGRTAYQLLSSDDPLNYHLKARLDLASAIPLLGDVSLPIDRSGKIEIIR